MSTYFKKFADISLKDIKKFGGKTSSLGYMYSSKIPIPNGFGISTEMLKDYVNIPFDEKVNKNLSELFRKLKLSRVAVRSSAIMEDGNEASWAGQLESYLNVEYKDLEKAIRACWESINAEHIKDYAKDKNLDKEDLVVGVAVQQMIDSDVSGVMFTVNPINQNRKEILIEGLFGLGEMLVQGLVTPDRFIVRKLPLEVEDFNIEIKSKKLVFDGKNNVEEILPIEIGDRAILKEKQIIELAKLGIMIEKHFKAPMDIEWAFKDGRFYIVQARPITTLI
jgi:phosphoenolpyruvate synthase/pyruvate phosphate dikinase